MIVWTTIGLILTAAVYFYCGYKGFERHEQYKAVAATLLATGCGALGIFITNDLLAQQALKESQQPALSVAVVEPQPQSNKIIGSNKQSIIEKVIADLPPLKWVRMKEKNFDTANAQFFGYFDTSKTAIFRVELLNKHKNTVVGIKYKLTVRNCGHAGGNRKNCPIESGPRVIQAFEPVGHTNEWFNISTKVELKGPPENHVIDYDFTKVAYFEDQLPKNKELLASKVSDPNELIAENMIDFTATCGGGKGINAPSKSSNGVVKAEISGKTQAHSC
jgi:hypothetical protein